MPIDVYEGISQKEIEKRLKTSEGKDYSLNHPEELVVSMRYRGLESPNANSQGWERSSSYYFKELQSKHPEYFGSKNTARINRNESPRVDAQYIKSFPQYKGFENEKLIHHHVGKDGQAVAVPSSVHKGSGEIHIYENKLGITRNAEMFSHECKIICNRNPNNIGCTSAEFKKAVASQNQNKFTELNNVKSPDKTPMKEIFANAKKKSAELNSSRPAVRGKSQNLDR